MKKISLKTLNLKEIEQLSREQLKDVIGGWVSSTSGTTTTEDCSASCQNQGDSCRNADCKEGSCGYRNGTLICVAS
ncbi:hypothetical protein [Sphingobacterium faecale]|uniref:Uncharacterized protein n=1 Tax=Sphingobacterium faecale TaxID=2803775 RepID=A0ABS1R0J0_9SPHI|nr:hypothetical protein [Sphingobacterium faecale]MBL1408208.1 hypothetical protein [Sphingobacterium faecale]